jgi:hypothetical protein
VRGWKDRWSLVLVLAAADVLVWAWFALFELTH